MTCFSYSSASDTPKKNPSDDLYGYAPFAQLVAKNICEVPCPNGLVFAINGPWGAGKTTALNFIKYYLKQNLEEKKQVVIEFNPWWFNDDKQLAVQFISKFQQVLVHEKKALIEIGTLLADYSNYIGVAVSYFSGIPKVDKVIAFILSFFKRKENSIPQLKKEISDAIIKSKTKFIFIVDDLDRLTSAQMREVFKVIKSLADFPNVIYLLAYDSKIVAESLEHEMHYKSGKSYLEKIIQVAFDLPVIDTLDLQDLLISNLNGINIEGEHELFDQQYWGRIFTTGMTSLIKTPRDVVRYSTVLSMTYPGLRQEVNVVDYFALELLRLKSPEIYNTIRDNQELFSGISSYGIKDPVRQKESERLEHYLQPANDGTRKMLTYLFPKLDNTSRNDGHLSEWLRTRRAAHPDILPAYFQYSIGSSRVSRENIKDFICNLDDLEITISTLIDASKVKLRNNTSKAIDILRYLTSYENEIDEAKAVNLLKSMFQLADCLYPKQPVEVNFLIERLWFLFSIVELALIRIHQDNLFDQLRNSIKDGNATTFICYAIFRIERDGKEVSPSTYSITTTITDDERNNLKEIALSKINEITSDIHKLSDAFIPLVILHRWLDWEPKKFQIWICAIKESEMRFLTFLSLFLSEIREYQVGDSSPKVINKIRFSDLKRFIDIDEVKQWISNVDTNGIYDSKHKEFIKLFNETYDNFKSDYY